MQAFAISPSDSAAARTNAGRRSRSSGGYPVTASSGKRTSSAPCPRASSRPARMRSRLPSRSPTTALIWASASRIRQNRTGLRLSGENIDQKIDELTIERRYRGPMTSANGGYTSGRLAAFVDAPVVQVTLRLPPPLDRPLAVVRDGERVLLVDGDATVAEAVPATLELDPTRADLPRRCGGGRNASRPLRRGGVLGVLHLRRSPGRPLHPRRSGRPAAICTRRRGLRRRSLRRSSGPRSTAPAPTPSAGPAAARSSSAA